MKNLKNGSAEVGSYSPYFEPWEIVGSWVSTGNSTSLFIRRNPKRKGGAIQVELHYAMNVIQVCRLIHYLGEWQLKFFGFLQLGYDRENDLLYISDYGCYKRAE